MNRETRKRIDDLMKDIEGASALRTNIDALLAEATEKLEEYKGIFEDVKGVIEELRDEEQEKYDNLSEGLQQSEKGYALEAAAQALEDVMNLCEEYDELEGFILEISSDDIITALDEAKNS